MMAYSRMGFGRSSSNESCSNRSSAVFNIGASNIGNYAGTRSTQPRNDGQFVGRALPSSRHYVYSRFGYDVHMRRCFFGSHATQQRQDKNDELARSDESVDEELILAEVEESNERYVCIVMQFALPFRSSISYI